MSATPATTSVSLLSVDKKTGGLTNVNQTTVEVGSGLKGIAATKKFLFAADPTTSEIFGFSINTTNGNLTPTAQGMLNTGVGTASDGDVNPGGLQQPLRNRLRQQPTTSVFVRYRNRRTDRDR